MHARNEMVDLPRHGSMRKMHVNIKLKNLLPHTFHSLWTQEKPKLPMHECSEI